MTLAEVLRKGGPDAPAARREADRLIKAEIGYQAIFRFVRTVTQKIAKGTTHAMRWLGFKRNMPVRPKTRFQRLKPLLIILAGITFAVGLVWVLADFRLP